MFSFTLAEFGLLDLFVILNYVQARKNGRYLSKSNKLALTIALMQEQDQEQIIEQLKELKNGRKN